MLTLSTPDDSNQNENQAASFGAMWEFQKYKNKRVVNSTVSLRQASLRFATIAILPIGITTIETLDRLAAHCASVCGRG